MSNWDKAIQAWMSHDDAPVKSMSDEELARFLSYLEVANEQISAYGVQRGLVPVHRA